MGYWSTLLNKELSTEQQHEIDLIADKYSLDLAEVKLALRREFAAMIANKDDRIATLERKLKVATKLDERANELDMRERELDLRDARIDSADELLKLREESLDDEEARRKEDYNMHHAAIYEEQKYAKELRVQLQEELADAKSVSREQGKSEGYSQGFKDGIAHTSILGNTALESANSTAKLLALVNGATTTTGCNGNAGVEQSSAQKTLADAFAKHLGGTIEEVLKTKKETK